MTEAQTALFTGLAYGCLAGVTLSVVAMFGLSMLKDWINER